MSAAGPTGTLAARIEALLPQTQCGECGHAGCAPFAAAVAAGDTPPSACAPGGAVLARRLAKLLPGPPAVPSFEEFLAPLPVPRRARIREQDCIGCTKCIAPCPTEAIVGAARQLHGVIEEDCTGCGLCLPPCPVDCISLEPGADDWPDAGSLAARTLAGGARIESCTSCGGCAPACPSGLQPMGLARRLRVLDIDEAGALGLARCTECRACDAACPVGIPLSVHFTHGLAVTRALEASAATAAHAVERQAERRRRPPRGSGPVAAALVPPPEDRDAAVAGIAAALARARARRDAATPRE